MKTITHYYCFMDYSTGTTNKLQEAVREFFDELNGSLFQVDKLPVMIDFIETSIEHLNIEFKRCTPFKVRFYQENDYIRVEEIFPVRFRLLHAELKESNDF